MSKGKQAKSKIVKIQDTKGVYHAVRQDDVIEKAVQCIKRQFQRGKQIPCAAISKDYAQLLLAGHDHEVFAVMFMDSQHRIIACEEMFHGTIDGASVYPREVVKAALKHNASAIILAHNHPSGDPQPSQADIHITHRLKDALQLVDVRVLDHLIVGKTVSSLAEQGSVNCPCRCIKGRVLLMRFRAECSR